MGCKHYWLYEQVVYQGPKGEHSKDVVVHRQCNRCGIHQMARTMPWRQPFAGYELKDIIWPVSASE